MSDLADEESDAVAFTEIERDKDTEWPEWSTSYHLAWLALSDDRFYGAMGGVGRIYYTALSRYAEDHNIPLYPFLIYVRAIDGEYVDWSAEQSAKENKD